MTASRVLVLATRNRGKLRELRELFADLPLELRGLDDYASAPEVVEDGDSFEHNARKKAVEIARALHEMALADDSGLEVDALGGRPGVCSARYAGEHANDDDNNALLIRELRDVPESARTARYRVVLALADPAGPLAAAVHLEQGVCEGKIRAKPQGENGFGYDPYFEPTGYSLTMAELPRAEKNRVSHRGTASLAMHRFLSAYCRPGR